MLCSYYTDFGSFNRGCDVLPKKQRVNPSPRRRRWHDPERDLDPGPPNPYNATMLKHMLQISMSNASMYNWTANAQYNADSEVSYNEVLIDSRAYTSQLPGSIAAVVVFDDAAEDGRLDRVNEEARIEATKAYVLLLDKYDLREADLPASRLSARTGVFGSGASTPYPSASYCTSTQIR